MLHIASGIKLNLNNDILKAKKVRFPRIFRPPPHIR